MAHAFSDLPDALVQELLAEVTPVAERMSTPLNGLQQARESLRRNVQAQELIRQKTGLDVLRGRPLSVSTGLIKFTVLLRWISMRRP